MVKEIGQLFVFSWVSIVALISLQPTQEDEDKLCEVFPSKKETVRAALMAIDGDLERAAAMLAEGKWLSGCKLIFDLRVKNIINILFTYYTAMYLVLRW